MFSNISWKEYWLFSIVVLLIYYFFVAIIFYKKELMDLLTGKKSPAGPVLKQPTTTSLMGAVHEDDPGEDNDEAEATEKTVSQESLVFDDAYETDHYYDNEAAQADAFDSLEELSNRLKVMMEECDKKINRAELMEKIRHELAGFSNLLGMDGFKTALNHFISTQAKALCRVELNESELNGIWKNFKA